MRVAVKQVRARAGTVFATPDRTFSNLAKAMGYAKSRVEKSQAEDMFRATVYDQNAIQYRCWIDAKGKFHETKPT
jgi:hypothetical protein